MCRDTYEEVDYMYGEMPITPEQDFGKSNEEEAYFYHTLHDFEQLVEKYGAKLVIGSMNKDVFMKLFGEIV